MIPELKEAFKLLYTSTLWQERKDPEYFAKMILYTHDKGWLWFGKEEGKIKAVAVAYRIKNEKEINRVPEKSEGEILYVPFAVSQAKDKTILTKMLKAAIKVNLGIKKIMFERERVIKNESSK